MSSDGFDIPITPVSLCQKLETDPTLQAVVSLQPPPSSFVPGSTLATVQGDNGSSTVDLDEQDLSFDIRSMSIRSAPGVAPVSYSPISENEWDDHWRLENSTTANINRDLVAGDDFEAGRAYLVEIAAVDASGFYGASCYASFILDSVVTATFPNLTPFILTDCSFPPSFNFSPEPQPSITAGFNDDDTTIISTTLGIDGGLARVTATLSIESNQPAIIGDFDAECSFSFGSALDNSGNPVTFFLSITGGDVGDSDSTSFDLPNGFSAFGSGSLFIKKAGVTIPPNTTIKAVLTFTACKPS